MESVLGVFASIDHPRDHTAQYELLALLFIALAATLCGVKSCVDIADFAEGNRTELAEISGLPGAPSHDTFSRLFRLLDPKRMEAALHRFGAAMRKWSRGGQILTPAIFVSSVANVATRQRSSELQASLAIHGKRLERG